jgi:hypothetical protein
MQVLPINLGNDLMKRLTILLVLALGLVACGSAEGSDAPPIAGCTETASEELFVLKMYECEKTRVYTFKDPLSRDEWRSMAEEMGTVITNVSDHWLVVKR